MASDEVGIAMEEDWEYLFDLCGYIVIRGVMSSEDIAEANAAVDRHQWELRDNSQHAKGTAFAQQHADAKIPPAAPRRKDLRHMLGWEPADRAPFVKMLAHPTLAPYLNVICGRGFRMDHAPTLITQEKGSPSGNLHGSSGPGFDTNQYYLWKNGQMHNGLVVVSFQLVDCPDGSGGLAVVPGSHKGNVRMPSHMRDPGAPTPLSKQLIQQAACDAGDVIICAFTASGDRIKAINRSNNPLARSETLMCHCHLCDRERLSSIDRLDCVRYVRAYSHRSADTRHDAVDGRLPAPLCSLPLLPGQLSACRRPTPL